MRRCFLLGFLLLVTPSACGSGKTVETDAGEADAPDALKTDDATFDTASDVGSLDDTSKRDATSRDTAIVKDGASDVAPLDEGADTASLADATDTASLSDATDDTSSTADSGVVDTASDATPDVAVAPWTRTTVRARSGGLGSEPDVTYSGLKVALSSTGQMFLAVSVSTRNYSTLGYDYSVMAGILNPDGKWTFETVLASKCLGKDCQGYSLALALDETDTPYLLANEYRTSELSLMRRTKSGWVNATTVVPKTPDFPPGYGVRVRALRVDTGRFLASLTVDTKSSSSVTMTAWNASSTSTWQPAGYCATPLFARDASKPLSFVAACPLSSSIDIKQFDPVASTVSSTDTLARADVPGKGISQLIPVDLAYSAGDKLRLLFYATYDCKGYLCTALHFAQQQATGGFKAYLISDPVDTSTSTMWNLSPAGSAHLVAMRAPGTGLATFAFVSEAGVKLYGTIPGSMGVVDRVYDYSIFAYDALRSQAHVLNAAYTIERLSATLTPP